MRDFPLRRESSAPGEVMSLERDRVLVGFASPEAAGEADRVLSGLGLMIEQEVEPHRPDDDLSIRFRRPINHTDTRVWARTVDGTAFRAGSFKPPEQTIEWVAPVYRVEDRAHSEPFALLAHVLLIKFDTRQAGDASGLLARYGLQRDAKRSEYLLGYDYCRLQRPLEESSIELRSRILKDSHEMVRDIQFDTTPMFVPLDYVPNDRLYPIPGPAWKEGQLGSGQWNMRNICAGGDGHTAWNVTQGDPSVVIHECGNTTGNLIRGVQKNGVDQMDIALCYPIFTNPANGHIRAGMADESITDGR